MPPSSFGACAIMAGDDRFGACINRSLEAGSDGRVLPYSVPKILVNYVRQEPPCIPTAFWRSVGPSHDSFVVETLIVAAAAKKDPIDFRCALSTRVREPRLCSSLQRKRLTRENRFRTAPAAECRFSSSSGASWRRLPKWRFRRGARCAFSASCAPWTAVTSLTRIPFARRDK